MLILILWDFPYNARIGELWLWTQRSGKTSGFIREAQHTRAGGTSVGTSAGHPEARPASWTSSETGQRSGGQLLSGMESLKFTRCWDSPGGSADENLPASAGDMGSSPGWGRSCMLGSNYCTGTTEGRAPRACALQQEKPLQWEACVLPWRVAPTCHN